MTTPTSQAGTGATGNHVPSDSLLRQLLGEIKDSSTPTVLQNPSTPHGTSQSALGPQATRMPRSVWVGGTSIAQEARQKLRAADQARYYKPTKMASDGTLESSIDETRARAAVSDSSSMYTPANNATRSKPEDCTKTSSKGGATEDDFRLVGRDMGQMSSPEPRPSKLCLPNSASIVPMSYCVSESLAAMTSPLMSCDADSDLSSTISPTDPPTSAISTGSTSRTTVTNAQSSPSSDIGNHKNKRAYGFSMTPGQLAKKMRSSTSSIPPEQSQTQPETDYFPTTSTNTGGGSTSTTRGPAIQHVVSMATAKNEPELSSSRPGATDYQGLPQSPITPHRPFAQGWTDEEIARVNPAVTPIFGRPLQLVDTEISVFKLANWDGRDEDPLCLYCFRLHGNFNKIFEHGCELCGRDEALDGYHWELYGDLDY